MKNHNVMFLRYCFFLFFTAVLFSLSFSQEEEKNFYFYKPENTVGSDAQFNPFSLFINGSYDILRNGGRPKNIWKLPYREGATNLWYNVRDPFSRIRAFGTQEFISQEIFNLKLNTNNAEFLPNFSDHVVGNGMEYAKLAEYLEYHQIPYPYLISALTTTAYQVMNEVIESDRNPRYVNVDMLADLYIYNTAGLILFSTEFGKQFFSKTLPTFSWNPQPIYEPFTGWLQNAGQNYLIRRGFSWSGDYSFVVFWGIYGMAGMSYRFYDDESFTLTFGQVVNKLKDKKVRGFRKTDPELDNALAFFYDKNSSLLFSTIITGPGLYNVQFNLYPGLFSFGNIAPGIFLGVGEWDKFIIGITFDVTPVGVGYGRR